MSRDKGFRRIVLSLMTLVTISVITVGAYLYFNFKSRSSLPVIVPKDVRTFMHFQTRKMRDESGVQQPKFMDSIAEMVAHSPLFSHLKDPAEAGISLYSDLVYFYNNKYSHCLALSLSSEKRFSMLLDSLKTKGIVGGQIRRATYNYVKFVDLPLYVAYKYKAMVLVRPTVESKVLSLGIDEIETQLGQIFSGNKNGFIQKKTIQTLYDADCQWLAWKGDSQPVGYCFWKGSVTGFMGYEGIAQEDEQIASTVFSWMRPSRRETSPEINQETEIPDGIRMLEVFFEDIFYYLSKGNYGY